MKHDWIPSTLGHGDKMCSRCLMTNLEATILGDECPIIFVFGSNLAGRHGKGAARDAMLHYGACFGVGLGRAGNSYAIPTKDRKLRTLPLPVISGFVKQFVGYATARSEERFFVTAIGTGLAGYAHRDIAPMFVGVPPNCILPKEWEPWMRS